MSEDITQAIVVDTGIHMLATTMSLVYPLFLRLAEHMKMLTKNPKSNKSYHPSSSLTEKFQSLDRILVAEIIEILNACTHVMNRLSGPRPIGKTRAAKKLTEQTKQAKNSVSWGLKALAPVFVHYNLRILATKDQRQNPTI